MLQLSWGGGGGIGGLSGSALALTVSQLAGRVPAQRKLQQITDGVCLVLIAWIFFISSPERKPETFHVVETGHHRSDFESGLAKMVQNPTSCHDQSPALSKLSLENENPISTTTCAHVTF